jgi:hypothetical protein
MRYSRFLQIHGLLLVVLGVAATLVMAFYGVAGSEHRSFSLLTAAWGGWGTSRQYLTWRQERGVTKA